MAGEKRYLVIGINHYAHAFHPTLRNAEGDALRFAGVLRDKYGFVPASEPLIGKKATNEGIREALMDLASSSIEADTVIVYYAGHGFKQTSDVGYWVPYDGSEKAHSYLDHSTVLNDLRSVNAKHILLISDSCYSGTFITQTRGSGLIPTADELEALDSRWIFASGAEQKVSDGADGMGSPFGRSLVDFLQNNTKPVLPAYEVFDAVSRTTEQLTQSTTKQQPQCEPMQYRHKGGQIIFRLLPAEVQAAADEEPATDIHFTLPENPALAHYMPRSLSAAVSDPDSPDRFFELHVKRSYLDELMETQRRLVILGAAGMGKSIELLYTAMKWNSSAETRRAVFARFNTYTDEDISALLPEGWEQVRPNDLYIFLDGLDEIQPVNFHTAIRKLSDFSSRNPLIGILVSCRTNFYELPSSGFSGTLPGFEVFHINDISYPEIIQHAKEKYGVNGESFLDQVHDHLFNDLVQKPFFLRVLLEHYKRTGNLNISRTSIMESALFEGYTSNKEHFYSSGTTLPKPLTFPALEKIAFVMEVRGKNYMTDDELAELFPSAQEYEQCKYLPAFSRDDVKNQWSFDHNNIQEYLASRILAKRSVEELTELMTLEIGGERKVKPNWVNTLSFLISTGDNKLVDPLLAWLVENDREILVRFEPDRIDSDQRRSLFRLIYDYYRDTGIWLHSNKFTDSDLANFGNSPESLQYLIEQLADNRFGRNNWLNAMSVLRHFRLEDYPEQRELVKTALLSLLDFPDISVQDIHSVMNTLYRLHLNDEATIKQMIARYGKRKNQYIRAGLYNLISHSDNPDQFVQVYLEGLDIPDLSGPDEDRQGVNLMDESMALTRGISELKSPAALKALFEKFGSDSHHSYLYQRDYIEIMEKLMKAAIHAFSEDTDVYQGILRFFYKETAYHSTNVTADILHFFDKTGTRYRALRDTWFNTEFKDYERGIAITTLLDGQTLTRLVDELISIGDETKLKELHELLIWHDRARGKQEQYLTIVESAAEQKLNLKLERPRRIDWNAINNVRAQQSFDMLFLPDQLQAEVNRVFDKLEKEELTKDDLYDYHSPVDERPESLFNNAALLTLRDLLHGIISVSREDVNEWFARTDESLAFRASHIYAKLSNANELTVTQEQIDFIQKWSESHPQNYRKVWFFLKRFNFKLPEEQVLNLTSRVNYSQENKLKAAGHIEQLEDFVSKDHLAARVIENLKNDSLDTPAWLMNAGYALRQNLKAGYQHIIDFIQQHPDENYSLDEVLKFWFEKTQALPRLKAMVGEVPTSPIRWQGIRIIEALDGQQSFLKEVLISIKNGDGEELDNRIYAANNLLNHDNQEALEFLADRILNYPEVPFDFRVDLGNMAKLKSTAAIPILLDLLSYAKQPEFKRDAFNDLESPVLNGLFAIGTQSPENFLQIKTALLKFIDENTGTLPNLNYLNFTIANMDEELRKKQSVELNIDEALSEYLRFTKS